MGGRKSAAGWRARIHVVQLAQALHAREVDSDFFARFAHRRRQKIRIRRLAPPAGQRDLPRPGIARAHRALDEQCLEAPRRSISRRATAAGRASGVSADCGT